MEITLFIDGKKKTFKQDFVNFITVQKAMEFQDRVVENQKVADELDEKLRSIETEEDLLALKMETPETDPKGDSEAAIDLIISYFNGQFTYDDFINGFRMQDVTDLYAVAFNIMTSILFKQEEETKKGKA